MPDVALNAKGAAESVLEYTIPGAQEIIVKTAAVTFDGTSAAGSFVPTLEVIAPDGTILASAPVGQTLAAGVSAVVSWFPRVAAAAQATSSAFTVLADDTLSAPAAGFAVAGILFLAGLIVLLRPRSA